VAEHFDAKLAEQQLGERSRRDPRRRFARRSALEHIARIVKIEFECAGKVGVAWPRSRQGTLGLLCASNVLHRERLLPVRPVAIFDAERNRGADAPAMADAGDRLDAIFFDFLSPAAPIAELAAV
jgi:hypothetical protein